MLEGACDCGAVTVRVAQAPDWINACPCSYCTRLGARWGYYGIDEVQVTGPTDTYRRGDKIVDFHRCATCGVLIRWAFPDGKGDRTGVNMTAFPAAALDGIPVYADP